MRPAIRTPRQARQRLSVAFSATTDVFRAAQTELKGRLPDATISNTTIARSHLRAAIDALKPNNNKKHRSS